MNLFSDLGFQALEGPSGKSAGTVSSGHQPVCCQTRQIRRQTMHRGKPAGKRHETPLGQWREMGFLKESIPAHRPSGIMRGALSARPSA